MHYRIERSAWLPFVLCVLCLTGVVAAEPADRDDAAARIVGAALVDSKAYEKLAWLTDRIGHRLSGSEALDLAIAWSVEQFRRDGVDRAWTEEVMVPHWVRGEESARIEAPAEHVLSILGLGGSVGTPEGGITAEVLVLDDLDSLDAVGDAARGKIVLFNRKMERGFGSEFGYGALSKVRAEGPSAAARHGAVAMLIRSLGTADYRLPHTGALRYEDDVDKIPSAAISAEDGMLIERLAASGEPVRIHLEMGARTLPDAPSANVLAEIRGRELPDEIVVIGAHLDSWDVGTGAHDDGAGCAIVMETMRLLVKQDLRPRRTIRAILFTNEENGLRGGKAYAERYEDQMPNHVAAIESDLGGAPPVGFGVTAGDGAEEIVGQIAARLSVVGAARVFTFGGGADISPMKEYGVPQIGQYPDSNEYFDYHHTEADTLDKVDPAALDRNVAAMALMAYMLADLERPLPRVEPEPSQ